MFRKLYLFILLVPAIASADETALDHFTHSITTVYISSEECAETLAPGPAEYMKLITDYFNLFYPAGATYWTLPQVTQRIRDRAACILTMQEKLMDYQKARNDYKYNYPEQPNPPVLLAYNWENKPSALPPSSSPSSLPPSPPGNQKPAEASPQKSPWQ